MKTIQLFTLAVISILIFSSFKPVAAQSASDGYYFFIVVDGTWKNGVGYASRIIHYSGYSNCKKYKNTEFIHEAKRVFSSHLQACYPEIFPNGENNNFMTIDMKRHSTSDYLKTRAQAEQRLTEWIADQKEQGYKVRTTGFSFSCYEL